MRPDFYSLHRNPLQIRAPQLFFTMEIGNDRAEREVVVVEQAQYLERHDSGESDPIWRPTNGGRLRNDCEAVGLVD